MRLTFVLLASFSLSFALTATQWRAHYLPVNGPWGGFAQGLAVDSSGNIFVTGTAASSGQTQTCLFKLDAQGNLRGKICFGTQVFAVVAVGPDGKPVAAGLHLLPEFRKAGFAFDLANRVPSGLCDQIQFRPDRNYLFHSGRRHDRRQSRGRYDAFKPLTIDQSGNIYVGGQTG